MTQPSSLDGVATTTDERVHADVTVVVVPRERYSPTVETVRGLRRTTPAEVPVLVVRGAMPGRVEAEVEACGGDRVRLVGPNRHLAPNEARRLGLAFVSTPYVVIMDNDVLPEPGWLEPLVCTAIERDAWAVRPVVLQADGHELSVHETGGDCHVCVDADGRRTLHETHRHLGMRPESIGDLHTEPVELFEFHTVLLDRRRLEALGGPDPRMLSQGDHLDLALRIAAAGGSVWLEPRSVVVYSLPDRLRLGDASFFLGRWSPEWTRSSQQHFNAVHDLDDEDRCFTWGYPNLHRTHAWRPLLRPLARALRRDGTAGLARRFDALVGARLADAVLRVDPRWRRRPTT